MQSVGLFVFLSLCLHANPSVFKPLCQGVRQSASSVPVSLSIYLSMSIVCQYLCLYVFISIHLADYLSVFLFIDLLVYQRNTDTVSLFVYSSMCQTVFLSVMLSVSLSVCRSVCYIYYCNMFYYTILLKCYVNNYIILLSAYYTA